MNKVILIGRLTRDPELRYTQSRLAVASFTLAVDRRLSRQKKQEMESQGKSTADFIRITVRGVQGENCSRYLTKGSQCAVEGRIQTGSYQDQQTGKMVYTTDVVADNVEFIGPKNQRSYDNSMNQDIYKNDYNQDRPQANPEGNKPKQGADDFFDDDFTEIEDDGRIPF